MATEDEESSLDRFVANYGKPIVAAQHQDKIAGWPWWQRLGHKLLVSHRCPACMYWKDVMNR